MRRFVSAFLKVLGTIALLFLLLVVLSGISPIYSFRSPQPYAGLETGQFPYPYPRERPLARERVPHGRRLYGQRV